MIKKEKQMIEIRWINRIKKIIQKMKRKVNKLSIIILLIIIKMEKYKKIIIKL